MPSPEERIAELEKKLAELIALKSRAVFVAAVATFVLTVFGIGGVRELLKEAKDTATKVVQDNVKDDAVTAMKNEVTAMKNEVQDHRDAAKKASEAAVKDAAEAKASKEKIEKFNTSINEGSELTKLKNDLDTNVNKLREELNLKIVAQGQQLSKLEEDQKSHASQPQPQKPQVNESSTILGFDTGQLSWLLWLEICGGGVLLLIILYLVFRRRTGGT